MGEKGSLKNLYKELWMRINYRLKKKKEEEELIRRMEKKYKLSFKDKTKLSFSLILGTIFYSFFSIFSKREEVIIKVIESEKDLTEVKKQVSEIKKEATRSINSVQITKCEEKIKRIDNIINTTSYKHKSIEKIKNDIVICRIYIDIKKENIVKEEKRIKKINQDLQEVKEDIKKTTKKIDSIIIDGKNIDKEKQILDIKKEIDVIERKIKENKISEEDIEKIDKFLLLSNSEELKKLKVKAEIKINELKKKEAETNKKTSENKKQETKKVEVKKEKENKEEKEGLKKELKNKKQEIKEIKKETKKKIDEEAKRNFESFNKIIIKDIVINRKQILGIRKSVKTKRGLLTRLKAFSRRTLSLCASLLPMAIFKNKALATLTSAILLNNSIRSMRMANGNEELSYYDHLSIKNIIREQDELETRARECFDDAFMQINNFKLELEMNFSRYKHTNEYREIVMDIQNIEDYITKKQKEHQKEQEKVKMLLKNY